MPSKLNKTDKCYSKFITELGNSPGMTASEAKRVGKTAFETIQKISQQFEKIYKKDAVGSKKFKMLSKPSARTLPVGDTGLIYGKVQSGKTNVSVATAALAISNNFKLVIVLTSDNVWLGEQTHERFVDGLRFDGPKVVFCQDWKENPYQAGKDLFRDCIDDGLVLVTTKNRKHLENLLQLLKSADYNRIPTLIIDDEADNASLNTFANKLPESVSSINKAIGNIRARAFYSIYLQVTATPQSLLLQGTDHPWQPQFFVRLDPGPNYMGGDLFFGKDIAADESISNVKANDYVQFAPQEEINLLNSKGTIVPSLQLAICTFMLGFAQKKLNNKKNNSGDIFSFLIHTSSKTGSHILASSAIKTFIDEIKNDLKGRRGSAAKKNTMKLFGVARENLSKTHKGLLPLKKLTETLASHLNSAAISVVNTGSTSKQPKYTKGLNFLIGGNKLGRGITIKGLMVTYYGRLAKSQPQMDTVHQHARMFGYRQDLKDVTRLVASKEIFFNFRKIHVSDEATRRELLSGTAPKISSVWVGKNLKPTRSNVIPLVKINAIRLRETSYPWEPISAPKKVLSSTSKIDKLLKAKKRARWSESLSVQDVVKIIGDTPAYTRNGPWRSEKIAAAVETLSNKKLQEQIPVYIIDDSDVKRDYDNNSKGFTPGSIKKGAPKDKICLILQRLNGSRAGGWDGAPFYVPTVIWPNSNYAIVYND